MKWIYALQLYRNTAVLRRNNQNFSQIIFYRRMLHINKKLRIKTSINYEKTTSDKNKYLKIVIGRSLTDEKTLEYFKIQESLWSENFTGTFHG